MQFDLLYNYMCHIYLKYFMYIYIRSNNLYPVLFYFYIICVVIYIIHKYLHMKSNVYYYNIILYHHGFIYKYIYIIDYIVSIVNSYDSNL